MVLELDLGPEPQKALSDLVYYPNEGKLRSMAAMLSSAGFRVTAVMHYPDDENDRRGFVASLEAGVGARLQELRDQLSKGDESWRLFDKLYHEYKDGPFEAAGGLATLIQAPHPRASQGTYAGLMLLYILERAEHCPDEASVNKACKYLARVLGRDKEFPASRAHILHVWKKFKPVAHLWGAQILQGIEAELCATLGALIVGKGRLTTLGAFLATAEELRKRGEQLHPRGRKNAKSGPILDPEQTWRVPPGLSLPTVTISLPPPHQVRLK